MRIGTEVIKGWMKSIALGGAGMCLGGLVLSGNTLTLEDAITEAMVRNLDLRIQEADHRIAGDSVDVARATFDPTLFGEASWAEQEQDRDLYRSSSETGRAGLGVTRQLSSGASLTLRTDYVRSGGSRYDSSLNQIIGADDLNHNSAITASIRQPLLKGSGSRVNLAGIRKAGKRLEIAGLDFRQQVLSVIRDTEKAYWQLAHARARMNRRESAIRLAETLLEETLTREEVGRATRLDVLQARANVASQREILLDAGRQVEEAEDALAVQLGRLEAGVARRDYSVESLRPVGADIPDLGSVWAGALARSLELSVQRANLEVLEEDRLLAKDEMRTNLDLVASASTTGLSQEGARTAYESALEKEGHDWQVGLEVSVPIGKRAAKAGLRQAESVIEREEFRLARMEQDLFRRVRDTHRVLTVGLQKLDAARLTLELETEAFEQQQQRVDNGLASFRDLQESQLAVDRAAIAELDAWLAVLFAEVELAELDGRLLDRHRIDIETRTGVADAGVE